MRRDEAGFGLGKERFLEFVLQTGDIRDIPILIDGAYHNKMNSSPCKPAIHAFGPQGLIEH